jgi:hypothetical protein
MGTVTGGWQGCGHSGASPWEEAGADTGIIYQILYRLLSPMSRGMMHGVSEPYLHNPYIIFAGSCSHDAK